MLDGENFITLLEALYRNHNLEKNSTKILEMCFDDNWRHMFFQALMRLERDERLDFFSMKNGAELWLYYLPWLKNEKSKNYEVQIIRNGLTWPGQKRRISQRLPHT